MKINSTSVARFTGLTKPGDLIIPKSGLGLTYVLLVLETKMSKMLGNAYLVKYKYIYADAASWSGKISEDLEHSLLMHNEVIPS